MRMGVMSVVRAFATPNLCRALRKGAAISTFIKSRYVLSVYVMGLEDFEKELAESKRREEKKKRDRSRSRDRHNRSRVCLRFFGCDQ